MPKVKNRKVRVLFICTGNACRSQMAEGLLRRLSGGEFDVHSAGTHPWTLHPLAAMTMEERGIDISQQYSKSVDRYLDESLDYVITLCDNAKELCPDFRGGQSTIHWSVPDPVNAEGNLEQRMTVFRNVRDDLEKRIKEWLNDLREGSRES